MEYRKASLALVLIASGCKSKLLSDAEAYEREVCACAHHDFTCAKERKETYRPLLVDKPASWFESAPDPTVIERHKDAANACTRKIWSCGDADECAAGYVCGAQSGELDKFCLKSLALGEACGGLGSDVCGPGLHCEIDPTAALGDGRTCDPLPCMGPAGKCAPGPASSVSAPLGR